MKKLIIRYGCALFAVYLVLWWLFYYSAFNIPTYLPGTPISISGVFLLATLIVFLWLFIRKLRLTVPNISILRLTVIGTITALAAECPFQLVRQSPSHLDTIGERLYSFGLAIFGTLILSWLVSFLISFKRKTQKTVLLVLFIILALVITYFIKQQFFPDQF